ncbi:D-arabinose 5-phosphate isomerase, partial [Acinetobacter nosocomialis]
MSQTINFQKSALETLRIEQQAIEVLATQLDERFDRACEILLQCSGRVVVT